MQTIDLSKCKNPTFSADGTNLLAKNAPQPQPCDLVVNGGNTIAKALDGSLSTYFDAPAASASGAWVGLDLGSARNVWQVKFAPRGGWAARLGERLAVVGHRPERERRHAALDLVST